MQTQACSSWRHHNPLLQRQSEIAALFLTDQEYDMAYESENHSKRETWTHIAEGPITDKEEYQKRALVPQDNPFDDRKHHSALISLTYRTNTSYHNAKQINY